MSCQSNGELMQNRSGLSVTKRGTHNTQDDDDEGYDDSKDDEDGGDGGSELSIEAKKTYLSMFPLFNVL